MATPVVHSFPGSAYLQSTLAALEEKGVAYEAVLFQLGDHKESAHLARNPFGQVPAFAYGDVTLYETQAIVRFIDEAFEGPSLQPAEAFERAQMNQLMGILDSHVRRSISAGIFVERLVAPMEGRLPDETVIADALPQAMICAAEIDRLMGEKPCLAGSKLSLADLMIFPQLNYFSMTSEGETVLAKHPMLRAWIAAMAERPGIQRALAASRGH